MDYNLQHPAEEIKQAIDLALTAVQPEEGKGLSSNDYTDEDKAKVDNIERDIAAERDRAMLAEQTKVNKTTTVNGRPLTNNITLYKSDIGLGNVDNTADRDKPISTATQNALNDKQNKLSAIQLSNINAVPNKANKSDVYTQSETRALIAIEERRATAAEAVLTGNVVELQEEVEELQKNAYSSIEKLAPYLFDIHYETLDYEYAKEHFDETAPNIGACSAMVANGFVGRNFDWYNNYDASFAIHTPAAQGHHAVVGIGSMSALSVQKVESRDIDDAYKLLPFFLQDGINDAGLFAEINVVPTADNTGTTAQDGRMDRISVLMLVRYILDNFGSVNEAVAFIRDHVDLYIPTTLTQQGYECHFLVADATRSVVLEIQDNELKVVESNKSTNFLINPVTLQQPGGWVYSNITATDGNLPSSIGIARYSTGLERWNLMAIANPSDKESMRTLMDSLYYTKTYMEQQEAFVWYSEFVGGFITVDTHHNSALMDVRIADLRQKYAERSKDTALTWMTTHSCVYDLSAKVIYVTVQEEADEFKVELVKSYGDVTKAYVDEVVTAEYERAVARENEVEGFIYSEYARAVAAEEGLQDNIDDKQDIVTDLASIRSGAAKGATSVQKVNNVTPDTNGNVDVVVPEVIDGTTSVSSIAALSAKQGKLLNDRINNIQAIGRFLALWDCVTGLPTSNPSGYPYEYHTGDYFRVTRVGIVNYMPNGSSYQGTASTTVYDDDVEVGDIWFYDGTSWGLQINHAAGTVQDVVDSEGNSLLSDAIAHIPYIATALADLTSDATHRIVTDVEKEAWNAKVDAVTAAGTVGAITIPFVAYAAQTLSASQQAQARANIGINGDATINIIKLG